MSKIILLANIGNRSLIKKIKNQKEPEYLGLEKNLTFKEETERVLTYLKDKHTLDNITIRTDNETDEADYEYSTFSLHLNILDALFSGNVDAKCHEISDIYLFTTDQTPKDEGDKDTLYAGELVKQLIPLNTNNNTFKREDITIAKIENKKEGGAIEKIEAVDAEELVKWYRNFFHTLQESKANENAFYLLCDSGGTPQQKTSMKLVAEYFLPKGHYAFVNIFENIDRKGNVKPGYKKENVRIQEREEYKRIINAQQIELLIQEGQYAAAAMIAEKGSLMQNALQHLNQRLLSFCDDLFKYKNKTSHSVQQFKSKFTSVKNFYDFGLYAKHTEWTLFFGTNEKYTKVCEALAIAEFYFYLENWTEFALATQIFIERFLTTPMPADFKDRVDSKNKKKKKDDTLINDIKTYLGQKNIEDRGYIDAHSVPTKIAYHRTQLQSNVTVLQTFLDEFELCFAIFNDAKIKQIDAEEKDWRGIDTFRNPIAHDGKGVQNLTKIETQVPNILIYLACWKMRLGLSSKQEDNPFLAANTEIITYLRNETTKKP